jgi:dihydroorotase
MLDLVVEGNAFINGSITKCSIGIEDGKIVALKKILKGEEHLDFGEKLVMPSGIDIHVHFRDPGFTKKEDFGTGTQAAAFGGIGCIFDMPNTKPAVITKESLIEKLGIVNKKAFVDFGLYSSIQPESNVQKIAEVCSAFKIFLGETTGRLVFPNNAPLAEAIFNINESQRIPAIHAEAENELDQRKEMSASAKNLQDHLRSRPNITESKAIQEILDIATKWDEKMNSATFSNLRIHLCHISASESVESLKKNQELLGFQKRMANKNSNNNITDNNININNNNYQIQKQNVVFITTEVTPHHLLLTSNNDLGAYGKVNPPLRSSNDQAALWSAFNNGIIQIIASDHAPHTQDDKSGSFNEAPSGLPGVETMLPLMLAAHKHHKVSLDRLISAVSEFPAKLFNLPKGQIAKGYDGDLIVVDFFNETKIKSRNLHSKCGWTPFENMDAVFPILTVVRGKIIVKEGNLESEAGFGRFYN